MDQKEPEEREVANPWVVCDVEKWEWAITSPK